MNLNLEIGALCELIAEYKNIQLLHNVAVDITDLECYVPTPRGPTRIDYIIKKEGLSGLRIGLENNIEIKCAKKHILIQRGNDAYADSLQIGDSIDTADGSVKVVYISTLADTTFYDIGIAWPHIYIDPDGILHHNTIITATLSKICEKYGRSVIIVPNKSLVEQTEEDYINCGLDVGVYYGDRKNLNKTHTICTWQSLNILEKKHQDNDALLSLAEFLDGVSTVIVDECFDGDSKVLTPTGYVTIKDIQAGDTIINYVENTKELKIDTVVKQHTNLTNSLSEKMYELEFNNTRKIQVTGNHKFLTTTGWVRSDQLTEHTELVNVHMKLVKRTEITKPTVVFNLHIQHDHNYIVEGAVVSNCHMAKADVLKKLLTNNLAKAPIRWGLTGTIPKLDLEYQGLRAGIGDVINHISAYDLQQKGVLSKCHVNIVQTLEWKEFRSYTDELKYLVTDTVRMTNIAGIIQNISQSGNTLVLVNRIESGKFLQTQLARVFSLLPNPPSVVFVSGEVKTKVRKVEYDEIKTSTNKIIIATFGVAAVGINIPRIFNLVLLEPGKSFVRVIQSIGRGIRKAEDKDFVQIWDLTASTKYAKRHLSERKKFYASAKYPFTVKKVKYA